MLKSYRAPTSRAKHSISARLKHSHVVPRARYCFAVLVVLLLIGITFNYRTRRESLDYLYDHPSGWKSHQPVAAQPRHLARRASSSVRTPPQPPRVFNDTVDSVKKFGDVVAAAEIAIVDQILKTVKPENATFENVILPYTHHENEQAVQLSSFYLYNNLAPDAELQGACSAAEGVVANATTRTLSSPEFFALVEAVYKKQKDDKSLDEESRTLLQSVYGQYLSSGFGVPESKRKRLNDLELELDKLVDDYDKEISTDKTTVYFTADELAGTGKDFIEGLKKGTGEHEGKLVVPLHVYSNFDVIMRQCSNSTTRFETMIAYNNQAPGNVARLEKAIALRDEKARIFGAKDFATYQINNTMAKTPKAVNDFLSALQKRLTPGSDQEIAEMKKLKVKREGKADHFFVWDEWFYNKELDEKVYTVDNEFIKEYFESTTITHNILDMYADIWSLKYEKIEGADADRLSPTGKGKDLVWHPDVQLFAVWNNENDSTKDDKENKRFIGYLYVDLFYRENKAGGSYEIGGDPGFTYPDGSRHYPTTAACLNEKKSESERPTLIKRKDVQTMLHELGHATHQLVSHTKYSRFHGPGSCPRDFVELPSQLMENWAYNPKALKRLSKHYSYISPKHLEIWKKNQKDPNAKQPPEMLSDKQIDNILANKNSASSYLELVQTFFSEFDMSIYQQPSQEAAKHVDTTSLWNHRRTEIIKNPGPEALGKGWKWGHRPAFFSHFMSGYEAGYYGYLWSRVDGVDVYYSAFKDDPFSSKAGGKWRHDVLQWGSSKDYNAIVEKFLGHPRNDDAFLKDLGIGKMKRRDEAWLD